MGNVQSLVKYLDILLFLDKRSSWVKNGRILPQRFLMKNWSTLNIFHDVTINDLCARAWTSPYSNEKLWAASNTGKNYRNWHWKQNIVCREERKSVTSLQPPPCWNSIMLNIQNSFEIIQTKASDVTYFDRHIRREKTRGVRQCQCHKVTIKKILFTVNSEKKYLSAADQ